MTPDEVRSALSQLSFYDQMRLAADACYFGNVRFLNEIKSTANPEFEEWSPDSLREWADKWEKADNDRS